MATTYLIAMLANLLVAFYSADKDLLTFVITSFCALFTAILLSWQLHKNH